MNQLKLFLILFLFCIITQILQAHEVEFDFVIDNADGISVSLTALAVSQIYDDDFVPTNNWQGGTVTKSAAASYTGFDWFTDAAHLASPVYIAYGIYKINGGDSYFYLNTMDGNYYESNIGYVRMDLYFVYDYATGSFTFEEPNWNGTRFISISDGDTIRVWQNHNYYPFGNSEFGIEVYEPNQECFNPKVYLKNKYLTYEDFGRLSIDEGLKYVESGDYANLELSTSHYVNPEEQFYTNVGSDNVQHHHWDDESENVSFKSNFTVENWELHKTANFEKTLFCSIKTNFLFGGTCEIPIEFKDPWLIEANGSQPGIFHWYPVYPNPFIPGDGHGALADQEPDPGNPAIPYYEIRVPEVYDNGDMIAVFAGWVANPASGVDFDDASSAQTDVVFKEAGVEITANFYHWYRSAFQGSIPVDLTLDGTVNVVGNVTVESDAKLTVEPGTDFLMAPGKSIIVNGQLYADGTSSEKITFLPDNPNNTSKTYWSGIKSYGPSTVIKHAIIKGGVWGVYANNSDTYLLQTHLENNHLALYILNDNGCLIDQCTMINNNYGGYFFNSDILYSDNACTGNIKGVMLSRCTGDINENDISNNSHTGIHIGNISDVSLAVLSNNPAYINNVIQNNSNYGVYIDGSSHPELGCYDENWKGYIYGGYNDFDHGSGNYDVYSENSTTIDARMNWWSASPSRHGSFLIVPEAGGILPKPTGTILPKITSLSVLEELLFEADSLVADSMYSDAIIVYKSIISLAPDDNESVLALSGLVNCYKKLKDDSTLITELNSVYNDHSGNLIGNTVYDYSVSEYSRRTDYQTALLRSDDVINYYITNQMDEAAAYALLEQATIYEIMANDTIAGGMGKITAATMAQQRSRINKEKILTDYSKSNAADIVRMLFNSDSEINNPNDPGNYMPENFALFPNYPNPFNPSTTISFAVPEISEVEIVIYDVLGKKIKTLFSKQYDKGLHSKVWDGTNQVGQQVSSGIYFYTFKAKALDGSKEIFNKSSKVLLLR